MRLPQDDVSACSSRRSAPGNYCNFGRLLEGLGHVEQGPGLTTRRHPADASRLAGDESAEHGSPTDDFWPPAPTTAEACPTPGSVPGAHAGGIAARRPPFVRICPPTAGDRAQPRSRSAYEDIVARRGTEALGGGHSNVQLRTAHCRATRLIQSPRRHRPSSSTSREGARSSRAGTRRPSASCRRQAASRSSAPRHAALAPASARERSARLRRRLRLSRSRAPRSGGKASLASISRRSPSQFAGAEGSRG